jgi:hypothetical protein
MSLNRITTRVTSLVTREARPGVQLDPPALAEVIKTTPWNGYKNDNGEIVQRGLDVGVEVGDWFVEIDGWDLTPEKVEILSQKPVEHATT